MKITERSTGEEDREEKGANKKAWKRDAAKFAASRSVWPTIR
jgi:hypothetical protein